MKRNDVKKLTFDLIDIWIKLKNSGLDSENEVTFDFYFYAGRERKIVAIEIFLNRIGYTTSVRTVRTAIIFKGYELRASLKGVWTPEILRENLEYLCSIADKFDLLLEGYGAKIDCYKY